MHEAWSSPFASAEDGDEYGVLLHQATDADFLGLKGSSNDAVPISFSWAITGEKILVSELREQSTLLDVYRKLRGLMPVDGLLRLVKGDVVYSEAGVLCYAGFAH